MELGSDGAWIGKQVAVGQVPVRIETAIVESFQRPQRNMRRPLLSADDFSPQQLSSVAAEEATNERLSADLAGIACAEADDVLLIQSAPTRGDVIRHELTGLFADTLHAVVELTAQEDDLGSNPFFELKNTLLLSRMPPDQDSTVKVYLDAVGNKQGELQEYLSYFDNMRDRVNR